jgi:hypothetical protein
MLAKKPDALEKKGALHAQIPHTVIDVPPVSSDDWEKAAQDTLTAILLHGAIEAGKENGQSESERRSRQKGS